MSSIACCVLHVHNAGIGFLLQDSTDFFVSGKWGYVTLPPWGLILQYWAQLQPFSFVLTVRTGFRLISNLVSSGKFESWKGTAFISKKVPIILLRHASYGILQYNAYPASSMPGGFVFPTASGSSRQALVHHFQQMGIFQGSCHSLFVSQLFVYCEKQSQGDEWRCPPWPFLPRRGQNRPPIPTPHSHEVFILGLSGFHWNLFLGKETSPFPPGKASKTSIGAPFSWATFASKWQRNPQPHFLPSRKRFPKRKRKQKPSPWLWHSFAQKQFWPWNCLAITRRRSITFHMLKQKLLCPAQAHSTQGQCLKKDPLPDVCMCTRTHVHTYSQWNKPTARWTYIWYSMWHHNSKYNSKAAL